MWIRKTRFRIGFVGIWKSDKTPTGPWKNWPTATGSMHPCPPTSGYASVKYVTFNDLERRNNRRRSLFFAVAELLLHIEQYNDISRCGLMEWRDCCFSACTYFEQVRGHVVCVCSCWTTIRASLCWEAPPLRTSLGKWTSECTTKPSGITRSTCLPRPLCQCCCKCVTLYYHQRLKTTH